MKVRRLLAWLCALALSLASASPLALAQAAPAETETVDESRAAAFRAVEGAQTENVPGGALMVGAYMVVLLLLVGYVARLGMLQRRTAAELDRLSALLDEREARD